MNRAKELSDAYAKSIESNNYKLLQMINLICLDFNCDLMKILESRDLNYAVGKTLDRYGEMLGVARGKATDDQYRINIIGKIGRLTTDGSCNDTINRIADIVGETPEKISIVENDMSVEIRGLSMESLEKSGYSSEEVTEIIKELIPICVSLELTKYAGTLLVMGEIDTYEKTYTDATGTERTRKYTVSYDENGNYQYFLYDHNPTTPEYIKTAASSNYDEKYPTLQHAWYLGMLSIATGRSNERDNYDSKKHDIGLSGKGEVPISHTMYDDNGVLLPSMESVGLLSNNGTFDGGSLGILSGEEWYGGAQ